MRSLPLLSAPARPGATNAPLPDRTPAREPVAPEPCGGGSDGAPACCAPEEAGLLAQGWTRRFVGDLRMTEDAIALYSRLGHEVMAVPLDDASVSEPCTGCAVALRTFRVVYTRRVEI